jgi:hypothetical protein
MNARLKLLKISRHKIAQLPLDFAAALGATWSMARMRSICCC